MEQTNKNTEGQKPQFCKLAILSPLIIICGFLAGIALQWLLDEDALFIILVSSFISLVSGIVSCWKIYKSSGILRGYVFSISGLVLNAILIVPILASLYFHRPSSKVLCATNMAGLGKAIFVYARDNNGRYPTPDMWCDLLIEHADVYEKTFVCRGALKTGDKGRCHYAINPNCGPNSPGDTVLLFETKGGWNQYGGPELLTTKYHKGKVCNIVFNDSHVRLIKTEQLSELKWDNKPKDKQKE